MSLASPIYNTKLFTEVWDNANSFKTAVKTSNLNVLDDSVLLTLYYLLYAKYGNSPIANFDENQFKYKVYSIIFQYGPSWQKRLEIQNRLRTLSEEEIVRGQKIVYNKALNDSGEHSTASLEDVAYINEQNVSNLKKSVLQGYAELMDLLETNVTGEFIDRFKVCFKQFVIPERPILYEGED